MATAGGDHGVPVPAAVLEHFLAIAEHEIMITGLHPDLTLWLSLSVQESLQRRIGDKKDRIEAEGAAFLERVAQGFAQLAQQRSWCAVAADQSDSAVRAALERQLQEHLA